MLSWEYPPHMVGGMGKHVFELAPALTDHGLEVHIVTPDLRGGASEEQVAPNVMVHRVTAPDLPIEEVGVVRFAQASNGAMERRARELQRRTGGFDIVHAHDWLVAYSAVAMKYAAQVPLVCTVHATERGRGGGRLEDEQARAINGIEWWLTYEAWRVITVSQFMAGEVQRQFEAPADKIDVINNGIVVPRSAQVDTAALRSFRRRFAADDEALVFFVGRLVYEKGIHLLVDAAPQIFAQVGRTKFVVAGTGPQLEALRQHADERHVQDAFHFAGYISDDERARLYSVADVAAFPSLYEPFGIVALEAMAYHCPVVAAATGGLAEVVKLHETGLTCYPGSVDSLVWAIVETLKHPEWARKRAENARREVLECYDWSSIAAMTTSVYMRVHDEWRRSHWGSTRNGEA